MPYVETIPNKYANTQSEQICKFIEGKEYPFSCFNCTNKDSSLYNKGWVRTSCLAATENGVFCMDMEEK